jgi:hypothetical protein
MLVRIKQSSMIALAAAARAAVQKYSRNSVFVTKLL